MKLMTLNVTPAQKSKLRNLKSIKISKKHKSMNGKGINMLVDESNYNALSKRFDNNKGLLFKLSASEIETNKDLSRIHDQDARDVISGSGLFKKRAKKTIKKIVDASEGETEPEVEGKGLLKGIKKGAKSNKRNLLLKM